MSEIMRVEHLDRFYGDKHVLKDIHFSIKQGESIGIIGPNGSGKTSLLELLAGVAKPKAGHVYYQGQNIKHYAKKEFAQSVAVLQQEALPAIDFTVRQIVEMGRYPYQNWLGEEKTDVSEFIDQIMEKMGLTSLAHRELSHLSGGERQRVALAKIMVQQPTLVMLDEPTTYLDIGHQIQLMDEIRSWQRATNLTVVSVLHDLNLAALYCEQLILMHQGQIVKKGTPEEIIQKEVIQSVYGTTPVIIQHPTANVPQVILAGDPQYFQTNVQRERE